MKTCIKTILPVCLLIAILLASGCAKKIVNSNDDATVEVAVTLKGMSPDAGRLIDHFALLVEGRDFGSLEFGLRWNQGRLTAIVQVPYGEARRFVIRGYDKNLNVLYEGERTVNILRGRDIPPILIDVYPMVPAITMTPHFQSIQMGSPFEIQLNAFNVEQLMEYTFILNFPTGGNQITLDSIILSPELLPIAFIGLDYSPYSNLAYVTIGGGDNMSVLVDSAGNAQLATCYFSGHGDTQLLFDSAHVYMEPSYMSRFNPTAYDTIALDSVLFDQATVELYRDYPPDTTSPLTWEVTFGGAGMDMAYDACPAHDEGYMIVGLTDSYGNGGADILLLHVDTLGSPVWQKTIGGASSDIGYAILPTDDGGYVIAGESVSFSPDGTADALLLKIDGTGTVLWVKTYNHGYEERAFSVARTATGDFVLSGFTMADVTDIYVVRTTGDGDSLWAGNYGGSVPNPYDLLTFGQWPSVTTSVDGGIIVAGNILSDANTLNIYLLKLDAEGQIVWTNTFGDLGDELAYDILPTTDGGFMVIGGSTSYGAGGYDIFLQKANSRGGAAWAKTFGGTSNDFGLDISPTREGGYIFGGSVIPGGTQDLYIAKIGSTGNYIWDKMYGGVGIDACESVFTAADGGYFAVGYTDSFGAGNFDMYLIKTDAEGNVDSPKYTDLNAMAVPDRNGFYHM